MDIGGTDAQFHYDGASAPGPAPAMLCCTWQSFGKHQSFEILFVYPAAQSPSIGTA